MPDWVHTITTKFQLESLNYASDKLFVLGAGLVAGLLFVSGMSILFLGWRSVTPSRQLNDFSQRFKSWSLLVPAMFGPVLLGGGWTMLAVFLLGLQSYREYSRVVCINPDIRDQLAVGVGAAMMFTGALLDLPGLFMLAVPLTICILLVLHLAGVVDDYLLRVGRVSVGFIICWFLLGHLALLATMDGFRNILFLLVFVVGMNDIGAYLGGRLVGKSRLIPQISPNKTVEGTVFGLFVSAVIVVSLGPLVFPRQESLWERVFIGVFLGMVGLAGDLVVSAIKRNCQVKDMGASLPGLGGFLDRFDSLILAAPLTYYMLSYG